MFEKSKWIAYSTDSITDGSFLLRKKFRIEKDIRNVENRATNCVARNISRSVEAAQEHISAIEKLMGSGKMDTLSNELRYTAKLRIENESATLTELALMHEPPLTKSGLNGRLKRLLKAANEED